MPRADGQASAPAKRGQLSPAARFVGGFVAGTAALLGIYHFPFAPGGILPRFMAASFEFYAHAAGLVARAFDPAVQVQGNTIYGRFSVSVSQGCDAIEMMIPLAVAILAFPARAAQKAIGLVLALGLVMTANIVRIASLYLAGARSMDLFELLHVDVWPVVLFAVCTLMFLLWARRANMAASAASAVQGAR